MKTIWYRVALAIVFIVAIALRVGTPDVSRQIIVGDETTYHYGALDLMRYHTITREVTGEIFRGERPATPTAAISPGYFVYIAAIYKLTGESPRAVLISQIVLSILSFFLIYGLLRLLKASFWGTLCALAVAAVYPGFLFGIDRMLTEQLYVALFLGFFYLFLLGAKRQSLSLLAAAALILGAATHVRAQASPFTILALIYLALYGGNRREIGKQIGVFAGVFILTMVPWWIRNYMEFHRFIPLTLAGDGPRIWGAVPYFLDMADTAHRTLEEITRINSAASPSAYLHWRLFGYMNNMWADFWDEHLSHPGRFLQIAGFVTQMLMLVPAMIAIPLIARKRVPAWTLVACIPAAVTLLNVPFHGLPRYAFPAVPFVVIGLGLLLTRQAPLSIVHPLSRLQEFGHKAGHAFFLCISIVYSVWALYSVYVFPARLPDEMSSYRIGKYAHATIEDVEGGQIISDQTYTYSQMGIDNSVPTPRSGWFQNPPATPGIFKLRLLTSGQQGVVTKITMNIRGGAPYDYTIVYWATPVNPDLAESRAYRAPRFWFQHHRTFYLEGDATELLMVPSALFGNSFKFESVRVVKYKIPGY